VQGAAHVEELIRGKMPRCAGGCRLGFVDDSPLERSGFEPSVPLARFRGDFRGEKGPQAISVVSKDFAFFGGPVVRIRFAPAGSLLRTWLSGAVRETGGGLRAVRSPGGRRFSSWFGDLMACSSYGSLKALAGGIEADRQRGSCGPGISARTSIRSFPKTSSTMSTRYEEVFARDDA
jgi:hypothetical protein